MIKIITENKWTILGIVIVCSVLLNISMRFFDKRPFRFEDFKTADELKMYLEGRYPIGSDGDIAYKDIELAGGVCHLVHDKSKLPNGYESYDFIGWCNYSASWISWRPKEQYIIRVLGNEDKKIIEFYVGKYSGFDI